MKQFHQFHDNSPIADSEAFKSLSMESNRVDTFYFDLLLTLSHGQATVERGFSSNKEVMVENLAQHSLVAQRVICDHVCSVGGVLNVAFSKELLLSAASARQRYHAVLHEKKEKMKQQGDQKGRGRCLRKFPL